DRVEADEAGAAPDVVEQDLDDAQQHTLVAVVEVHLVGAERRPYEARAVDRAEGSQEVRGPRPEDETQVVAVDRVPRAERDEEILEGGVPVQVALEPAALRRDVVEDAVEHQPEAAAQLVEVLPAAEARVDLLEVDDREAAIGGVREEREDVDRVDGTSHED